MHEALGRGELVERFLKGARSAPPLAPDEDLVPITIRVPIRISDGLIDACAERRKRRVRPWSQQGIATEALEVWLKGDLASASDKASLAALSRMSEQGSG